MEPVSAAEPEGLARAHRDLEALATATRALGASSDVGPALTRIAAAAREIAGADFVYVTVHDPALGVSRVIARAGTEGGTPGPDRDPTDVSPPHAGEISLPVVVEEEVAGQLVIVWPRGRPGGEVDMDGLGRLASLAAVAIRHRRLATTLAGNRDPATLRADDLTRVAGQLRRIVDAAKDGIVTTDGGGLITSANPAAEAMFGQPAPALFGRPVAVVLPGLQLVGSSTGRTAAGTEIEGVRPDGSRFPAELSVSAVTSDGGRAFVVIVRDVTDRKAVERMKDEFVATVSHELRTPLTALRGHVELVLEGEAGPVTDLQQRFLQIATQSADRLGALINDLLDVAKIEAGRVQLRRELVDLVGVLRDVSATYRLEADRRGLAFQENLPALPQVVGDRDRLIQVFGNLVSNALKYTRAGGVGIEARTTYGAVEVVVHDTGLGMTAEEQRQLFTKFFRSRDRTGPDPGGTGLGLVIAKGIVEGHGGTLSVESEPGVGSRFRVVLPAVGGPPSDGAGSARAAATVLVVDDEVAIRDLLLEYLQVWDYAAVPASSGPEALELARRITPDLIILDVGMLPMSGLDVLRQAGHRHAEHPGAAALGVRRARAAPGPRRRRLPAEAGDRRPAARGRAARPGPDPGAALPPGRRRPAAGANPEGARGDRARGESGPDPGGGRGDPVRARAGDPARRGPGRRAGRAPPRPVARRCGLPRHGRGADRRLAAGERARRAGVPRRNPPRPARLRRGGPSAGAPRKAPGGIRRIPRWLGSSWPRTSSRSATWWPSSSPTPVTT